MSLLASLEVLKNTLIGLLTSSRLNLTSVLSNEIAPFFITFGA